MAGHPIGEPADGQTREKDCGSIRREEQPDISAGALGPRRQVRRQDAPVDDIQEHYQQRTEPAATEGEAEGTAGGSAYDLAGRPGRAGRSFLGERVCPQEHPWKPQANDETEQDDCDRPERDAVQARPSQDREREGRQRHDRQVVGAVDERQSKAAPHAGHEVGDE